MDFFTFHKQGSRDDEDKGRICCLVQILSRKMEARGQVLHNLADRKMSVFMALAKALKTNYAL